MSRQATLETLKEYFASKGKFLTIEEYKDAADAPFRFQIVKRIFGSWSRLKGLVGEVTVKATPPKSIVPKSTTPKQAAKPGVTPVAEPVEDNSTDNG